MSVQVLSRSALSLLQWHFRVGLLLSLALCLVACGGDEPPGTGAVERIEGSVLYRERMMLPPEAVIQVQLQDISRPDALAAVLATVDYRAEGGPPYPFTLEYRTDWIDGRGRYALRATISVGDRLLFTSTEYIDPFAEGPIEVLVQRVPEPVAREGAAPVAP